MTTTEFIAASLLRATGKTTTLATSNSKYTRLLALGNFYIDQWSNEPGVDWASLYNPAFSLGTVTATDTYDLDTSTIRKLSDRQGDSVRIVWSDKVGYTDYTIVDHDKINDYSYGVSRNNPIGFYCTVIAGQLVFNHTFTSTDQQYGGEIFIPAYVFPDAITSTAPNTDEIQVDDSDWLITRAAAEYVRNDITRQQHYPELLAEANEIMERMKDDNEGQVDTVDRPWSPTRGTDNSWNAWY